MVLRELCGGLYFGKPRGIDPLPGGGFQATDANFYTSAEIERIARTGFELARRRRGHLISIDKANVMESGVLWRRVVTEVGANQKPEYIAIIGTDSRCDSHDRPKPLWQTTATWSRLARAMR